MCIFKRVLSCSAAARAAANGCRYTAAAACNTQVCVYAVTLAAPLLNYNTPPRRKVLSRPECTLATSWNPLQEGPAILDSRSSAVPPRALPAGTRPPAANAQQISFPAISPSSICLPCRLTSTTRAPACWTPLNPTTSRRPVCHRRPHLLLPETCLASQRACPVRIPCGHPRLLHCKYTALPESSSLR